MRLREDSGASLFLVLCFVGLVGALALSTTFVVSTTMGTVTDAARVSRQQGYAADAALELAIKNVQADPTGLLGSANSPACSYSVTANGYTATATCQSADGTSGVAKRAQPSAALMVLDKTLPLVVTGNSPLPVSGPVAVNSYVTGATGTGANAGVSIVNGGYRQRAIAPVAAADFCATGRISVASGYQALCNTGAAAADPNWTSRPTVAATPTVACDKKTKVAQFSAGTFSVTATPALLLAAAGADCANVTTLYFPPGVYTFTTGVIFDTGSYTVVAGQESGWLAKGNPSGDGTDCDSSRPGSQFVLQDSAALTTTAQGNGTNGPGTVTICAGTPTGVTQPAIALYSADASAAARLDGTKWSGLWVHGATYLPKSVVSLALFNSTGSASFDGGLVIDSGTISASASVKSSAPFASLTPCSAANPCRTNRNVSFTATVNGTTWTQAQVAFDDQYGGSPGQGFTKTYWSVVR